MCEKVRDLIDLYVAGDLEAEEAAAVETHLAGCASCRREADSYRHCLGDLAELNAENQPDRLSPFFWQGIQRRILVETEQKRARRSPVWRVAFAVAAAVLLAVTAYLAVTFLGGTGPGTNEVPPIAEKVEVIDTELLPPGTPVFEEGHTIPAGQPAEEDGSPKENVSM
jgi:anti-sigma-K factor RskA